MYSSARRALGCHIFDADPLFFPAAFISAPHVAGTLSHGFLSP